MPIVNGPTTDHGPRTKTNHKNSDCHYVTDELKIVPFVFFEQYFL